MAGGLTPNGGNLDGLESDSCEAATALQGHPTIKRGPTHLLYTDCSFYSFLWKKFDFLKCHYVCFFTPF